MVLHKAGCLVVAIEEVSGDCKVSGPVPNRAYPCTEQVISIYKLGNSNRAYPCTDAVPISNIVPPFPLQKDSIQTYLPPTQTSFKLTYCSKLMQNAKDTHDRLGSKSMTA